MGADQRTLAPVSLPRSLGACLGFDLFIPSGDQKVSPFALIDDNEASGHALFRLSPKILGNPEKSPLKFSKYWKRQRKRTAAALECLMKHDE